MVGKLPDSASVATPTQGDKLHAPAAARNVDALCDLIRAQGLNSGKALEIASGTGQHAVAFARVFAALTWQPTDVDPARLASIGAYCTGAGLPNLEPPVMLDAARPGWHAEYPEYDLILLVNLLHLVNGTQAQTIIAEAMRALAQKGCFILYGPFKRQGQLTSAGDAQFHAQLIGADADIGYKNDADVAALLRKAGAASVTAIEMPANNLAFVARR